MIVEVPGPKVAKALCSVQGSPIPAGAWTDRLDCLSVPHHVLAASVLETLSPCSPLWLPSTLPVYAHYLLWRHPLLQYWKYSLAFALCSPLLPPVWTPLYPHWTSLLL